MARRGSKPRWCTSSVWPAPSTICQCRVASCARWKGNASAEGTRNLGGLRHPARQRHIATVSSRCIVRGRGRAGAPHAVGEAGVGVLWQKDGRRRRLDAMRHADGDQRTAQGASGTTDGCTHLGISRPTHSLAPPPPAARRPSISGGSSGPLWGKRLTPRLSGTPGARWPN